MSVTPKNFIFAILVTTFCLACSPQPREELMPLLGNESCVQDQMGKFEFEKYYGHFSIEPFTLRPESHQSVTGQLRIKPYQKNLSSIKPILNTLLAECYPKNLGIGPFLKNDWSNLISTLHTLELESKLGKIDDSPIFIETNPKTNSFSIYQ